MQAEFWRKNKYSQCLEKEHSNKTGSTGFLHLTL